MLFTTYSPNPSIPRVNNRNIITVFCIFHYTLCEVAKHKLLQNYFITNYINATGFAKRYLFHKQNLAHVLHLESVSDNFLIIAVKLPKIFYAKSSSIRLHFDIKSNIITYRSQMLHHFGCWHVKCVKRYLFANPVTNYIDLQNKF